VKVDNARYSRAQGNELEWWKNNAYTPFRQWHEYDKVFLPYYPDIPVGQAVDVGSGPVPMLCNHNVFYRHGIAIDPLIHEYAEILKYDLYLTRAFTRLDSIVDIKTESVDMAFCLNTLDHVQDPQLMVIELGRILRRYGKLFFFVDIDKRPDSAHPHAITRDWLAQELLAEFYPILWLEKKSWKFDNQALYFVGEVR